MPQSGNQKQLIDPTRSFTMFGKEVMANG